MYTRCPHCTTIFRVTAEQLRTAHGDVPCVTCGQSFGALDSLSDDVTTLIGALSPAATATVDTQDETLANDVVATDASGEPATIEHDDAPPHDRAESDDDDIDADADADTARHPTADGDTDANTEPDGYAAVAEAAEDRALTAAIDAAAPEDGDAPSEDTAAGADPDADVDADTGISDEYGADDVSAGPFAPESEDEDTEPPHRPDDADDFPLDSLEFDAPEQTWTRFFLSPDAGAAPGGNDVAAPTTFDDVAAEPADDEDRSISHDEKDAASLTFQTADPQEWQGFLAEIDGDASTVTAADEAIDAHTDEFIDDDDADEPPREIPIIPPWLSDDTDQDDASQRPGPRLSRAALGVGAAALVLLCGQLIHYNRDQLATHPSYGSVVRQFYALFDAPLFPQWSLDLYQVSGTEAVTGRTAPEALDILANVIVGGEHPVGLPLVRVVLHDRWSNAVASRVFTPAEYLRDSGAAQNTVAPGTALPIEISVIDPGADALGYVVDICLPRRKAGLECQIARDPFK